jgi:hypothetical protein
MLGWAGGTAVLGREKPGLSPGSERTSHAARGSVAKTPYFPKTISCPVLILGESGDSGRNPVFGWTWKEADNSERISGEFTEGFQTRDQG